MAPRRPDRAPQANGASSQPITGPTSALTSFLREQGITGQVPGYNPQQQQQQQQQQQPPAPPARLNATTPRPPPAGSSSSNHRASVPSGRGGRGGGNGTKPKVVVGGRPAKRAKLDAGQAFKLAGKPEGPKMGRYNDRIPGAISMCGECGKRFTVTKYTVKNPLGGGLLCSPCSNESFDKPAVPKPKAAPKKRAVKTLEEREYKPVKTLQQVCINVIGSQIDNVEALGDIGPKNLDRIAKIVCKHRALTSDNLELFLDVSHRELSLYDCTNIKADSLASLAMFCPHLERLTLRMCGRLDASVLEAWAKGLKELKYLSLYAPYLVTFEQWKTFLRSFGPDRQLEGFGIEQSPRFDDDCIRLLVSGNPGLYNLQLAELGKLSDVSLSLLHPLSNLTSLDISRAGVIQGMVLTDTAVIDLLQHVGANLVELVLDQNYLLTTDVLTNGVIHCPLLRSLSLKSLSLLNSAETTSFFTNWSNTGLTHLNLHRCIHLENDALLALLDQSGHSLRVLDLHSLDEIHGEGLTALANKAVRVEKLDVSFVRAVDNAAVLDMLTGMEKLEVLFIHGDNHVTDCPQKKGVSIRGQENCMNIEL